MLGFLQTQWDIILGNADTSNGLEVKNVGHKGLWTNLWLF